MSIILKKSKVYLKILLVFFISLFLFGTYGSRNIEYISSSSQESDAIAIKILENERNHKPLVWYQRQGYTGSPQEIKVGGYPAIQHGRSIYVNVGEREAGGGFNSHIYLISHNQDVDPTTLEIYRRLVSNWTFNTDIDSNSGDRCEISAFVCLEDEHCPQGFTCRGNNKCLPEDDDEIPPCRTDEHCPQGLFCNSDKAKLIRDTIRVGDIREIEMYLRRYESQVGQYPGLGAGTYLPGMTMSVWPSWQDEFAQELGWTPPLDPINVLGECAGDNYDPRTCWDDVQKRFGGHGGGLNMPNESSAYGYQAINDGEGYTLCTPLEYTNTGGGSICSGAAHGVFVTSD